MMPVRRLPGLWVTVAILLRWARRRAKARFGWIAAQHKRRTGATRSGIGLMYGMGLFFSLFISVGCWMTLNMAVLPLDSADIAGRHLVVISPTFARALQLRHDGMWGNPPDWQAVDAYFDPLITATARRNARYYRADQSWAAQQLRDAVHGRGQPALVVENRQTQDKAQFLRPGSFNTVLWSIILLLWSLAVIFQGEQLERDFQRRRHPLWEWLLSHPVSFKAVFIAELLAPVAANPAYVGAALFPALLYGTIYGTNDGMLAFGLVGVPLVVAGAALGKAIEIGVMLQAGMRSRGAIITMMSLGGFMGWMAGLYLPSLFMSWAWAHPAWFAWLGHLPWPWIGLMLGQGADQTFSFWRGVLTCDAGAVVTLIAATLLASVAASRGITGRGDNAAVITAGHAGFGKNPLYHKELLWIRRDRGAIVQMFILPLIALMPQIANFSNPVIVGHFARWNGLCGAGILAGSYFLMTMGPRSLQSEGAAFWLQLTWPLGLENLLRAKARFWAAIASVVALLPMAGALYLYPADAGKILLAALAWGAFAWATILKTVTLAAPTLSSGEIAAVPAARRWVASLGLLGLGIGVISGQYQFAVAAIVFAVIGATALWQDFRAHLPYLFDPWSVVALPPPTILHGVLAILALIDLNLLLAYVIFVFMGLRQFPAALTLGYDVAAAVVVIGAVRSLHKRGASAAQILMWRDRLPSVARPWAAPGIAGWALSLLAAVAGGIVLSLGAHGYLWLLDQNGWTHDWLEAARQARPDMAAFKQYYAIAAIGVAPWAEEYIFRGLLYRALDREWGGWRAVLGSALCFTVLHPMVAWGPVFVVGALNAYLFKKTGKLAAPMLLHFVYNAAMVPWG